MILYKEENEKTVSTDYYQNQTSQNFKKLVLLPTLKGSLQSFYVKVKEEKITCGGEKGRDFIFHLFLQFLSIHDSYSFPLSDRPFQLNFAVSRRGQTYPSLPSS